MQGELYLADIAIPPKELVVLLDALLPLCQQALYSKSGHVGCASEAVLVHLSKIDPIHVTPPSLDFATHSLDISGINLARQAPAALSALTRLVQLPSIRLSRLPELLRLSFAGVDSNDQNKTIRTLTLYRNLALWIPVGSIGRRVDEGMGKSMDQNGFIHLGNDLMSVLARVSAFRSHEGATSNVDPLATKLAG